MSQSLPKNKTPIVHADKVNLFYEQQQVLFQISLSFYAHSVTALIGPSGCGKSSFLRILNRLHDLIPYCHVEGQVLFEKQNILATSVDVVELRRQIGMVFQKPNPFPKSIYDNIAYAPKLHGLISSKQELDQLIEESLRHAGLWDEVKDRLHMSALSLSGGQQQRLCIARAIAVRPRIILMDEPCSALDPIATAKVEALIDQLKKDYTIILVTHSMQQAARVSEYTAFFHQGHLIEHNPTQKVFTNPDALLTQDYITGRLIT